mgnify:CR=1 FL=1
MIVAPFLPRPREIARQARALANPFAAKRLSDAFFIRDMVDIRNNRGVAADISPHKQGKYIPGVHVPILPPDAVREIAARPEKFMKVVALL